MDTLGTTRSVLIKGVSSFRRLFCTHIYIAGTVDSVLIKEVFLFQKSLIETFHVLYFVTFVAEAIQIICMSACAYGCMCNVYVCAHVHFVSILDQI